VDETALMLKVSPATVIGGVTANTGGQLFVEAFNLPRM
jgi:hypothetical protein